MCNDNMDAIQPVLLQPVTSYGDKEPGFIALPPGWTKDCLDRFLDRPRRIEQSVELDSIESFHAYICEFRTEGTACFAKTNAAGLVLLAVLDYHGSNTEGFQSWAFPSHCGHVATLQAKFSSEFNAWRAIAERSLDQTEFAEFLLENAGDIQTEHRKPVLNAAANFRATASMDIESMRSLETNVLQTVFTETVKQEERKGSALLPAEFQIRIPVFENLVNFAEITVFVRWRIVEKKILFYLHPKKMDKAVTRANSEFVTAVKARFSDCEPALPFYAGWPE